MSIEDSLSRIATALEQLVSKQSTPPPVATKKKGNDICDKPVVASAVPEAAPVIKPEPAMMTDVPTVVESVPTVAPLPFSDKAGLTAYIMAAYKKLGPISGSKIEGIIQSLGFNRVSDVTPDSFFNVYNKVEELIAQSGDK